ncbi:MAG: hypothetical protein KDK29_00790 [Sedimentitalea sp.]|nr:hypothetical protein [Sedimentitalea sp.]
MGNINEHEHEIAALREAVLHEVVVVVPAWHLRAWFEVTDITKNVLRRLEEKLNPDGKMPIWIQAFNDGTKHGRVCIAQSDHVRPVSFQSALDKTRVE